ncbi:unnamed protein product [Arabidopsis lyrata]|nr:unnamed protein product [Arabidopsis lyrata]
MFAGSTVSVRGSISDQGVVTHITGGNFAQSSITINGWLCDFLWAQASQVLILYGLSVSCFYSAGVVIGKNLLNPLFGLIINEKLLLLLSLEP